MNQPRESLLKSSYTVRWLIQAALGILLLILLGIHLTVNHFAAPQGLLAYADVVRYFDIPGIAWMESGFLIVVTVHCALGLHSILLDLNLPIPATRIATRVLAGLCLAAIVYGLWLTQTIVAR